MTIGPTQSFGYFIYTLLTLVSLRFSYTIVMEQRKFFLNCAIAICITMGVIGLSFAIITIVVKNEEKEWMQKWGLAMRSWEFGLSDNEKSFFDYKKENLNHERDLNSWAIFACYILLSLLHLLLGAMMYLLHDKIETVHIREKRARLPQDHEKDFHECVKFTY